MRSDQTLKAMSIYRQLGCGTFYTYKVDLDVCRRECVCVRFCIAINIIMFYLKVAVSNGHVVNVAFHLGGKRATPLVGPPHFDITKNE
jgi:hypothetical protein